MPKLWNETIDAHRREVRDAILDTAAILVSECGLRGVTMSAIAEQTGIGRATLYKYFADVEAILAAWHEREIGWHLNELIRIAERAGAPDQRLEAVLEAYALRARRSHGQDATIVAALHQGRHVTDAEQRVHLMVRELVVEAGESGSLRVDIAADELVAYCLSAVTAAEHLTSQDGVHRLIAMIMTSLRATRNPAGVQ